jgi:hypothetical protein
MFGVLFVGLRQLGAAGLRRDPRRRPARNRDSPHAAADGRARRRATGEPAARPVDLVADADALVLVLGSHYSGPTEDEFNEARRLGRPVVVLKQRVALDVDQQEFLDRLASGWVGGRMWAEFEDERDVLEVAVEALANLGRDRRSAELGPAAQQRAA